MKPPEQRAPEDVSIVFARESAVSALVSVVAGYQPELVEQYGGHALESSSHAYYIKKAERLMQKYQLSRTDIFAEAITSVIDAMDEHDVAGFVQLPPLFDDIWPKLPEFERVLSTPAEFV